SWPFAPTGHNPRKPGNIFRRSRKKLDPSEHLRSLLVGRHKRPNGRVVESAGTRSQRKHSGPGRWNNRLWSGSGGGRRGTGLLPARGRARPLGFCRTHVVQILMNSLNMDRALSFSVKPWNYLNDWNDWNVVTSSPEESWRRTVSKF